MHQTIKICFVIGLCCLLLLSGCAGKESEAVIIGFNLEMTGKLAQYGQNCMDGARLAVEEINEAGGLDGRPLEILLLDNRSENADAALVTLQLAQKGASAVIGPTNSNLTRSALSAEAGIPMIIPSATADTLVPENAAENEMFRVCYTDSVQGWAMGQYAWDLGMRRVAILTESSSDYSRGISASFSSKFCELGGEVVDQEFYTSGECDFYTVLTRLRTKDFDALFVPGYYTEAGLIIRQLNELGIDAAVLSGDAFDSPVLEEIVGKEEYLNNIFFTNHYAPDEGKTVAFSEAFVGRYEREPSAYAALGYDSVMLFCDAYRRTGEEATVAQALAETVGFNGVTGLITIDEEHNAEKDVRLIEIREGVRVAADTLYTIGRVNSAAID